MFEKLRFLKLLPAGIASLDDCMTKLVCEVGERDECYLRTCDVCKGNVLVQSDDQTEVSWEEWVVKVEKIAINGNEKTVRKTVKNKHGELWEAFHVGLQKLCAHTLRIRKQFSALKYLKESAGEETVVIVVDFSENYNCKYARETQSTHFGGYHAHRSRIRVQNADIIRNHLSVILSRTACHMGLSDARTATLEGAFPSSEVCARLERWSHYPIPQQT